MSRNWPEYNRRLVKRGEFYFSMDFLDSWERELSSMNRGKRGRRYLFPISYIQFTSFLRTSLHLQYRQAQGALRKLGSCIPGLKTADYTTLWRRAATLDLSEMPLSSPDGSEVVSIDASGFKVTNRGDWMRHIWHTTRRGWIKVSIAVDVETKELLAIEVSDESRADNAYFKHLVDACTGSQNSACRRCIRHQGELQVPQVKRHRARNKVAKECIAKVTRGALPRAIGKGEGSDGG